MTHPILVTGAAGRIGGVGGLVVEALRRRALPRPADVGRALAGCRRVYFGMSVSAPYLEATVTAAAVARARGDLEVFVNISQMTVSQMSLTEMTDSPQQRQHWLAEQAL